MYLIECIYVKVINRLSSPRNAPFSNIRHPSTRSPSLSSSFDLVSSPGLVAPTDAFASPSGKVNDCGSDPVPSSADATYSCNTGFVFEQPTEPRRREPEQTTSVFPPHREYELQTSTLSQIPPVPIESSKTSGAKTAPINLTDVGFDAVNSKVTRDAVFLDTRRPNSKVPVDKVDTSQFSCRDVRLSDKSDLKVAVFTFHDKGFEAPIAVEPQSPIPSWKEIACLPPPPSFQDQISPSSLAMSQPTSQFSPVPQQRFSDLGQQCLYAVTKQPSTSTQAESLAPTRTGKPQLLKPRLSSLKPPSRSFGRGSSTTQEHRLSSCQPPAHSVGHGASRLPDPPPLSSQSPAQSVGIGISTAKPNRCEIHVTEYHRKVAGCNGFCSESHRPPKPESKQSVADAFRKLPDVVELKTGARFYDCGSKPRNLDPFQLLGSSPRLVPYSD